jgi:hypothetical protein
MEEPLLLGPQVLRTMLALIWTSNIEMNYLVLLSTEA